MDLEKLLNKASDVLSVGRAFGPPIERDGLLVIPVAWVAGGGGGGTEDVGGDSHGGAGGGFGGVTWPLGVYVVKGDRVRWVPAVDATRIALAGIGLVRTIVKLTGAGRRRSHA